MTAMPSRYRANEHTVYHDGRHPAAIVFSAAKGYARIRQLGAVRQQWRTEVQQESFIAVI